MENVLDDAISLVVIRLISIVHQTTTYYHHTQADSIKIPRYTHACKLTTQSRHNHDTPTDPCYQPYTESINFCSIQASCR